MSERNFLLILFLLPTFEYPSNLAVYYIKKNTANCGIGKRQRQLVFR